MKINSPFRNEQLLHSMFFLLTVLFLPIVVTGQTQEEVDHVNKTIQIYNKAGESFMKAISCWKYKGADYECSMKNFIQFSEEISPILISNPSYEYDKIKIHSKAFKDMARRYVRFMINCNKNRKQICDKYDCMDLAWNMMENIKALNYRYDILGHLKSQLPINDQYELDSLFAQLMEANSNDRLVLENKIIQFLPEFKYLAQNRLSPRDIQQLLKPNEVFISFFITDNRRPVFAWKIERNKKPEVIKLKINSADLFLRIESIKGKFENDIFYKSMVQTLWHREKDNKHDGRNPSPRFINYGFDLEDNLKAIYEGLIIPLNLKADKHLIVATDQNISALPFDLLPWTLNERMYERFDFSYISSARVFAFLRNRINKTNKFNAFLGLGLGKDLPYTNVEVNKSARYFQTKRVVENATENDFYTLVNSKRPRYDVLHIASHSIVSKDRYGVKSSSIVLNKAGANDGILTSKEIVKNGPRYFDLVVLSGCETAPSADIKDYLGVMKIVRNQNPNKAELIPQSEIIPSVFSTQCVCSYGETFSNLSGALFSTGNRALLMSQWKIEDKGTALFYENFYSNLKQFKDVHHALRVTKQSLSHLEPHIWAGFIYCGD